MAEKKTTTNSKKKYIAKAVLVDETKATVFVGDEVELTDNQAKRLLEIDAIEEVKAE